MEIAILWTLPVGGFVVASITNWIALKCVFQPVQPRRFCGFTFQGLFLKRQQEVAAVYAQLLSSKVLNAENLLLGMLGGPCSNKLFTMLDKSIQQGIDNAVPSQRVIRLMIGTGDYSAMKSRVCELVRADIKSVLSHLTPYIDEALNVQETLQTSMAELTSQEFADILMPVFKEGELKLILIGGFLGLVVGMLQACWQVPEQLGLE